VNAEPEAVTVTNGTQQALDLVARVLLAPGDRVAVEDPGYSPPALLFKSLGLQVTGVPVDGEGLMVDSIPRNTKLVYVTPSHQYPLGTAMSLPRRIALLAWADRHNAAIVEDDYDSEFRFGERPIEPVQTLDTTGRVIYVGSFSKTMLPTLRMGFVITPPSLWDAVHSAKFMTDWHTSLPMQRALATFIDQGSFARHVRKMRTVYRGRHERILHFLSKNLSPHFSVIPSAAGLHISAFARTFSVAQIDELVQRVAGDGVAVQPLSMFRVSDRAMSGLVLGYGAIPASQVDAGLRILLRHTNSIAGAHRLTR
jgi:GntR family transcriptional regulator/MocR family aminotransferase